MSGREQSRPNFTIEIPSSRLRSNGHDTYLETQITSPSTIA